MTQSGSYEELLKSGTPFEQLVNAHKDAVTTMYSSDSNGNLEKGFSESQILMKKSGSKEIIAKEVAVGQLTEEEQMTVGDVGWKPFYDYIHVSRGLNLLCLSIATHTCFVVLQAAATYWLAVAMRYSSVGDRILIAVYTGTSVASNVFVFLRSVFAAQLGLKASKAFFTELMTSVFRAPMMFFDSTPVGRIFTRVSNWFLVGQLQL